MGMLIKISYCIRQMKTIQKFLVLVGILKFELTLYCYHVFCFDKYLSICCYSSKCANLKLNENEYDHG
jgi:hypothetical protein